MQMDAPGSPTGFEGDAFAPLWAQPESSNPWFRQQQEKSAWSGFGGQATTFQRPHVQVKEVRREDESGDERMEEDMNDAEAAMDEDEDRVERAMEPQRPEVGFGQEHRAASWEGFQTNERQAQEAMSAWERGRRKP